MSKIQVDLLGFSTVVGTPAEVRSSLEGADAGQVVAVRLPRGSADAATALARTLDGLVPLVGEILEKLRTEKLERIVGELVGDVPPPRHG